MCQAKYILLVVTRSVPVRKVGIVRAIIGSNVSRIAIILDLVNRLVKLFQEKNLIALAASPVHLQYSWTAMIMSYLAIRSSLDGLNTKMFKTY